MLSAAHCVDQSSDPNRYSVALGKVKFFFKYLMKNFRFPFFFFDFFLFVSGMFLSFEAKRQ